MIFLSRTVSENLKVVQYFIKPTDAILRIYWYIETVYS
jgi:hypothetical protein